MDVSDFLIKAARDPRTWPHPQMSVSFRERRSARRRADAFSRRYDVDVSGDAAAESKRVAARERERGFAPLRRPTTCGGRGDGGEEHGHHCPRRRRRSEQRQRRASRPPAILPNLPGTGPGWLRPRSSRRRGLEGGSSWTRRRGRARAPPPRRRSEGRESRAKRSRGNERASDDNLLVCTWGPAPTAVRPCVRPFSDQIISPEITLMMK